MTGVQTCALPILNCGRKDFFMVQGGAKSTKLAHYRNLKVLTAAESGRSVGTDLNDLPVVGCILTQGSMDKKFCIHIFTENGVLTSSTYRGSP